jgi:hypothetical protein
MTDQSPPDKSIVSGKAAAYEETRPSHDIRSWQAPACENFNQHHGNNMFQMDSKLSLKDLDNHLLIEAAIGGVDSLSMRIPEERNPIISTAEMHQANESEMAFINQRVRPSSISNPDTPAICPFVEPDAVEQNESVWLPIELWMVIADVFTEKEKVHLLRLAKTCRTLLEICLPRIWSDYNCLKLKETVTDDLTQRGHSTLPDPFGCVTILDTRAWDWSMRSTEWQIRLITRFRRVSVLRISWSGKAYPTTALQCLPRLESVNALVEPGYGAIFLPPCVRHVSFTFELNSLSECSPFLDFLNHMPRLETWASDPFLVEVKQHKQLCERLINFNFWDDARVNSSYEQVMLEVLTTCSFPKITDVMCNTLDSSNVGSVRFQIYEQVCRLPAVQYMGLWSVYVSVLLKCMPTRLQRLHLVYPNFQGLEDAQARTLFEKLVLQVPRRGIMEVYDVPPFMIECVERLKAANNLECFTWFTWA